MARASNAPKLAFWILDRCCDERWCEELKGDLEELYADLSAGPKWRRKVIFWYEFLRLLRPHFFKRPQKTNTVMMTFNHLKVSYRNLLKQRIYTFINMLGLSIGIASMVLLGLYIQFETSYDAFFDDSDRIHRVALHRVYPGRTKDFGTSAIRLAPVLKENYPEVEEATRLHRLFFQNEIPIQVDGEDKAFIEDEYLFADSLFFRVFSYPFIQGNPETALDDVNGLVITRSTAMKYFGTAEALNKTVTSGDQTLQITGVIEDIPDNSHIHFDLLGPLSSLGFLNNAISNDNWSSPWVYTYVKFRPGVDAKTFSGRLDEMDDYANANLSSGLGANWKENGHAFEYFLQPLTSIHLHSQLDVEVEPNSNISYIYVLGAIALFILLISGINFVNLSIARSTERAKEVGIRKVMGSNRWALIGQFLTESVFVATLSAVIGISFLYLFIPIFNDLLNTSLTFQRLLHPLMVFGVVVFVFMAGILSGLYPAVVISGQQPSRVLKGAYRSSTKGQFLRNSLITFQFLISIVMISGSIIADQQMKYLQKKDLGFDKEALMVVRTSGLGEQHEAFTNAIRAEAGVIATGGANMLPGDFHGSNVFSVNDPEIADIRVNSSNVDDDYIGAMGFQLVEGRGFDPSFNDSLSIVVNEATVRAMGIESALGYKFQAMSGTTNGNPLPAFTIVGVVRDYNFYSLHSPIGPMVIFNGNTQFRPPQTIVRFNPGSLTNLLSALEARWSSFSDQPFQYSFLADDLELQYQADRNTAKMFDIFTYVAIILSCTGLFGLATYVVNQRSKEMSVRKVLGASVVQIVKVFSKDFALLIVIAFVLGVPLAYYALDQWLGNFAYHTSIGASSFLIAGAITLLLVAVTVSYQALKMALVDPAKILRSE